MDLAQNLAERLISRMTADERRELVLSVVERMLSEMSASDRSMLMERVVDRFLDGLSDEERQATVRELVPRLLAQLMQSGNMDVDELLWAAMGSLGALEKDGTEKAEGSKQ